VNKFLFDATNATLTELTWKINNSTEINETFSDIEPRTIIEKIINVDQSIYNISDVTINLHQSKLR
jgi:hypothetical protein